VSFIDLSLPASSQTIGMAQLLANGTAAIDLVPSSGMHTYRVSFVGSKTGVTSISPTETLSVTGLIGSATTLTALGTPANYTLTGTVSGFGYGTAPTGTVSFIDTSASNAVLGTANLSSTTFTTTNVAQASVTTDPQPVAIATGDFNGDGFVDAVTANAGDGTLTVMLGNGDGTFSTGMTISSVGKPTAVIADDFNDDGILDLAVVDNQNGNVYIFLGNGDGTFRLGSTITVGTSPYGIAAGDLNQDGNLDLAVTMDGANATAVLLGHGDGTFTVGTPVAVGSSPRQVVIADFNNDGKPDIATANFGGGTVSVALGNGDGTFAASAPVSVGNGPIALAAADVNGDGNLDLAVANQTDNTVDVLLGNGAGGFALTGSPLAVDQTPSAIVASDYNGDGMMDLLTANAGTGTVSFLSNNGGASFAAATPITAGTGADALAAVDLNGDGRDDLIAANSGAANVSVYLAAQVASVSVGNITFPATGSHLVVATYSGDSNYATSTSSPVSLQSDTTSTTTTLTASPTTPAAYGQTVTLTATVAPATNFGASAGGTVTFYDQGVAISPAIAISNGVAAVTLPLQTLGGHVYTAVYSGSTGFLTSTSSQLAYTVAQSAVTLTLPAYSGAYGTAGTTTVTVVPQNSISGQAVPTGTISYQFPGFSAQTATLVNGAATITVPAGVPVGTASLTVGYGGDANYAAGSGSLTYTITGMPLTVTVNNATSVYGAALPTFSGTITGAQNGDVLTATYGTTATSASAVGTYPITATVQGANASNYTVTVVPGTLTITQAPLTISANNATRLYGAANPAFTGSISGTLNGDALSLTFTTTAVQTSDVGTYPIVPVLSGAAAGNYAPTVVNGTLTITAAAITITANNATRLYGAVNPTFTDTITGAPAGFTPAVTNTTTATQFSTIGTYAIVPSVSGTVSGDYTVTPVNGVLTVTQAPTTTALVSSAGTIAYGSSVTFTATVTPGTSGVPTGQVSFYDGANLLGMVTMTNGNVSLPTIGLSVGTHTITAVYAGDTNFTGSTSNSIAQIVQQATLTVTVNSATRAYGAADPVFTSTITGAVAGDSFTVTYTTNETVTSGVGSYIITPHVQGTNLANYALTAIPGTLTITPAALTVTANNATRSYDTANPVFTGAVTGAVNNDTFVLTFSTTATLLSDVGNYPIVPAVNGSAAANYTVTVVDGTLVITPATGIVVTAGNATRVYGTANPVFTGTVSGTYANLGLMVSGTTVATISSDAGTYAIVPALTGVNPADYSATFVNGVLTVSPAATSIVLTTSSNSAVAATNVTLTAAVASATTGTPTGTVYFYTGTTFLGASALSSGVASLTTNAIPQGTNTVTARYNGNIDFTASQSNGVTETITSNLPVLVATADSFTRVYGAANPTFTGTVSGALNGDTFTESFTTTATASSLPGTYAIVPVVSGVNLANYQLTVVPGVLTITQTGAAVLLTVNSATTAYGSPVVMTATLTGSNGIVPTGNVYFFDGSTLLGTVASVNGVASLTVSTLSAGVHALTARTAGDANYGPTVSNAVTETITGTGGGSGVTYTITASPTSLTIKQGGSGTTTLTITPINGYTGQLTMGCTTLPQYSGCVFSPVTFTLNGTTPVTVTLTIHTNDGLVTKMQKPELPGQSRSMASLAGFTLLPALLLAGIFGMRRRSGLAGIRLLALLMGVAMALSLSGCVKVNVVGSGTLNTPIGTSTVTVTASPTNVTTGVYNTLPLVVTVTQ
jgi:hypothetical protein